MESETFHTSARSEDSSQRCVEIQAAAAATAAARHTNKHRETCCGGHPLKVDFRIQGIPQDAALVDQGRVTKIQELVDKLPSATQTKSIVPDLRM